MSYAIKLSDDLVEKARCVAKQTKRSVPKQIEYWAELGSSNDWLEKVSSACRDNPDLPFDFVEGVLKAMGEETTPWDPKEMYED